MVELTLIHGDCLSVLKMMPSEFVDCIITSPPYWGLRDYGGEACKIWDGDPYCEHEWEVCIARHDNLRPSKVSEKTIVGSNKELRFRTGEKVEEAICKKCGAWYGQLGLEPTLDLYLKHILQITAELKRVLKKTGVMFWVHGDSYSAKSTHSNKKGITNYDNLSSDYGKRSGRTVRHEGRFHDNMPEKCLLLQNYRLAIRMIEEQGWILRNVLIWYKPNHMPSSVRDRLTNTYEPVFMFVKSRKYWFDLDAIRIPHKYPSAKSKNATNKHRGYGNPVYSGFEWDASKHPLGKNPGDMWVLPTEPFPDAHFAVFPTKLAELLVRASCPPEICRYCGFIRERIVVQGEFIKTGGKRKKDTPSVSEREKREGTGYYYKEAVGWTSCGCKGDDKWRSGIVLDPFLGSGTTMVAARNLGRNCIGIEINSEYIKIAKRRLNWGNSIEFMKFRYLEEEDIERNPFLLSR